ncbi:MAG: hypothetical protein HOP23_09085 [Methylococcaceae bacterium]|nr:hypothetical protein [Methylococcaceae bacterium]
MTDFENDLDDWDKMDDLDFSDVTWKNQRIAVRYVREDIAATVCKISMFNFGFRFSNDILVELMDISSKGVLVSSDKKLKLNKKITLTLIFEDSKTFKIPAKIVRRSTTHENQYGIKFDRLSNDLGDYLLDTQRKLIFK